MDSNRQRFAERANDFLRAATRLSEACEQLFSTFIRDSVIQRFEFCWELAWKLLKMRLEQVGVVVLALRDVFREALDKGLIEDSNTWSEARNECVISPAALTMKNSPNGLSILVVAPASSCFRCWRARSRLGSWKHHELWFVE